MNLLYALIDACRNGVKRVMRRLAGWLNRVTGGQLTPTTVTVVGLIAHLPVAWLIADGQLAWAALGLVIFGLFDTLDGELARLQDRTTAAGMFLDSTTDRIKEVLLYCGIVAYLASWAEPIVLVAAIGAVGASLITSYINAWGEVAMAASPKKVKHQVNKALRTGLGGFEVRMFLIVVGLLLDQLETIVYVILVLAVVTVGQRIANTLQKL